MNNLKTQYIDAAKTPMESAQCLPFSLYTSEEAFLLEKNHIFHQDWVFICAEQELPDAGDYFALSLADEPILVIRGDDSQLRALSNVCRHRGTLLNDEGTGNARRMVCPYHAWTYETDGALLGAPLSRKGEVNKSEHCLPQFRLEIWNGLVFVSLNPESKPLSSRFSGIERYLTLYGSDRFDSFFQSSVEHWQCNWKLAMENAMESYHLFKVHKETLEKHAPTKQAFYLEGGAAWTLTAGKYVENQSKLVNWVSGKSSNSDQHYVLISLPPSFVGILTQDSISWLSIYPDGPNHCTLRSAALSTKGKLNQAEKDFTQAFFSEDKGICERVHQGMFAQHSKGGKLVELEKIIVDFHHYLASQLSGKKFKTEYINPKNVFFDEV